ADAYNDLADAVEQAREAAPPGDPTARWCNVSAAFRDWAIREPQQFGLIFGPPLPGFVAPAEGPAAEACDRAISNLAQLFLEAHREGKLRPPLEQRVDEPLRTHLMQKAEDKAGLPPHTFQAMLLCWASLYVSVSLEAY